MAKLGANVDGPIELRFIAALDVNEKGESKDSGVWQAKWQDKAALASADGQTLGFGSTQNLVAGRVTGATTQLYAYDAAANRLECASCPADGSLPAEEVNKYDLGADSGTDWQGAATVRHWVSSGGDVFFTTPSPLLAADQNNVRDVYDYRDGALHLITHRHRDHPGAAGQRQRGRLDRVLPKPRCTRPPRQRARRAQALRGADRRRL